MAGARPQPVAASKALSPRQNELLHALGRIGATSGVAEELGISPQTVKNHLTEIFRRLGVHSGPQAIYHAFVLKGVRVEASMEDPSPPPPRRLERFGSADYMPPMVDGQIRLFDLRIAMEVLARDTPKGERPLMNPRDMVEWLSYHVDKPARRRA